MLGRFDLTPIFLGHWKGLTNVERNPDGDVTATSADWVTRAILYGLPIALGVAMHCLGWQLHAPTVLLTAVSLFVGGALAVFAQFSTLRLRLTDRSQDTWNAIDRDAFDESVAHLLMAVLAALADAAVLGVALNVGSEETVTGLPAVAAGMLTLYLLLLLVILMPRLYAAYALVNKVPRHMSGLIR